MRAHGRVSGLSITVLAVLLIATAGLSTLAFQLNSRNETRLLDLQTKETGAVLQEALPTIQTPLAAAAELAASDGGDARSFTSYISTFVGPQGPFESVGLWQADGQDINRVAHTGVASYLAATPAEASSIIATASRSHVLTVVGPIDVNSTPRIGYAFASTGTTPAYVVYAESPLPPGRRVTVQAGSAFSDLDFALYLGKSANGAALLESNSSRLPVTGRTDQISVAFGSNYLTLVAAPKGQLGGTLSGYLWWIVALAGAFIAVIAALVTERLVRRRRRSEQLTREIEQLLGEQRSIAVSLQHALLPQTIPRLPGVDVGVRYIPGVSGVEIGGDWYDLVELDGHRFFFVVGDVSGRGVNAGTVMASLLFAIRGFLSEGHPPGKILDTLSGLLDVSRDGHFATVLCGIVDIGRHEVSFANAGHLPPLLVGPGGSEFVSLDVGPPIGVPTSSAYQSLTVPVPPGATLIAYTDGLVERPAEHLDTGLARLQDSVARAPASLEGMLDAVVAELAEGTHHDDTAILGIRWLT